MHSRLFKALINIYPPYLGTGIQVKKITPDYREILTEMTLRWYNRNYVGTHFGGSLYAMVDPFYMLMLMQILGKSYTVWDKSSHIEFIRPARGTVQARFEITDADLHRIYEQTRDNGKYLPVFEVNITQGKTVVARAKKELYVRRKKDI